MSRSSRIPTTVSLGIVLAGLVGAAIWRERGVEAAVWIMCLTALGLMAMLVIVVPPAIADCVRRVRLARRTRLWMWRKAQYQCLGCGYDLRATPDRCPECGATPGKPL